MASGNKKKWRGGRGVDKSRSDNILFGARVDLVNLKQWLERECGGGSMQDEAVPPRRTSAKDAGLLADSVVRVTDWRVNTVSL